MISTPICDFAKGYAARNPGRFHMPGHKGKAFLGCEDRDLTEIEGADDLYHPAGIIAESEANASKLFGWPTVYSTEGSSLCIRAMLALAYTAAGRRGRVLAGRNAHKTFLSAAILLDFPIRWLWAGEDYLSCPVTPEQVEQAILEEGEKPFAVYLTSPDYLGNMADIRGISGVCRKYGVRLLVDNAHGAYLKFLPESRHPMDLGADYCCDSAHKTLPVLTGGAYLHFREEGMRGKVKDAMALFGSTSPSYLVMQSLDLANPYLEGLPRRLKTFLPRVAALKGRLLERGLTLSGEEPLKLTWVTGPWGYTGVEIGEILEQKDLICEFRDERHIVFMFTPENDPWALTKLEDALCEIPRREALTDETRQRVEPKVVCSPRQAALGERERIPVGESAGRILANLSVSCPPAVPIIMCGEEIEEAIIPRLRALGWAFVEVVK